MIRYHLSFPDRVAHFVEVVATFPVAPTEQTLDLFMPVWTPGSYLVREFARHLEALTATNPAGTALAVEKTRKNRWRVAVAPGLDTIVVRYRLYARDLTVRTNFVDPELALLHGAATFLFPVGGHGDELAVSVDLPADWTLQCALPTRDGALVARDVDQLVDSPLLCGRDLAVATFHVGGVEHALVDVGADRYWPAAQAAADVERIVATELAFWGEATPTPPYDRYVVFNLIADGAGGLEHAASTVLLTSRFKARSRKGYLDWLGLVSHEFFHTWNVKRLRPRELGPFDYENEVYTPDLWFVEGITSYYDDLLVHRAGLASRDEYLAALSDHLERLATTPGRDRQSLALSSFDTWIKFYRPDDNSPNSAVSYYVKGAVVAWLLDIEIRRRSADANVAGGAGRSLDDALRLAYRRHSGDTGFGSDEIRDLLSEVAGASLADFFAAAIDGTAELDLAPALRWLGLRLAGPEKGTSARGWLGMTLERRDGRAFVAEVRRGTPAATAGVSAGDELLGLGGYRVPAPAWEDRLALHRPGETVDLLVARRERLMTLPVTFGSEPASQRLEVDPGASAEQRVRMESWLTGRSVL